MKASEIVESIKDVLGMELSEVKVKLEVKELENGTKLEAESFEEGKSVFIISEGEEQDKIAVPVGEYNFSDGTVMLVKEEGKIAELRDASDKEEEEMRDDGKEAAVDDWEGMEKRIKNLEDAVADLKAEKENKNSEEVEASEEVEEKVEASKTELNQINVAAEPISHNPEGEVKKQNVQFAKNRRRNTLDRVLEKMNNQ